jgi:hypothetical protein
LQCSDITRRVWPQKFCTAESASKDRSPRHEQQRRRVIWSKIGSTSTTCKGCRNGQWQEQETDQPDTWRVTGPRMGRLRGFWQRAVRHEQCRWMHPPTDPGRERSSYPRKHAEYGLGETVRLTRMANRRPGVGQSGVAVLGYIHKAIYDYKKASIGQFS